MADRDARPNLTPVMAANRVGVETDDGVTLDFYGSSFISNHLGALIACAPRDEQMVIIGTIDLDQSARARDQWGVSQTRRPEIYQPLARTPAGPPPASATPPATAA